MSKHQYYYLISVKLWHILKIKYIFIKGQYREWIPIGIFNGLKLDIPKEEEYRRCWNFQAILDQPCHVMFQARL